MAVRFLPLSPQDPSQIAGYKLHARLGAGGMGVVYLSFTRGRRPVAIKVVKRELADDPEFSRRFRREVAAAQRVQGHYTAPVLDADPGAPVPWLATAYIAGPSLQSAVAEHGPFERFAVFRLLAGAAEGISAVHAAGLIHRDLKPANVLLADDGPRVIDFGIAHAADASTLTGAGQAIGTPAFMTPEQIHGKAVDATDVWALLHLAVYAATGHTAFGDGNESALLHRILNDEPDLDDCPAELRPLAEQCLAKEPASRPSVDDVLTFAQDALRGQTMRMIGASWLPDPVAATLPDYDSSAAPPPRRRGRRLLRPVVVAPAAVIVVIGGLGGYLIGSSGTSNATPPAVPTQTSAPAQSAATPPSASPTTSVAPSVQSSPSDTASPGGASSGPGPSGYAQEYQNVSFTLPGDACQSWLNGTESYVTFAPTGPQAQASDNGGSDGDLELTCGSEPGIDFDGNNAGYLKGQASLAACVHAVETDPVGTLGVPLTQLTTGEQFCVYDSGRSQLALVTLTAKNSSTYDLTWSATGWLAPQSGLFS
jgi:eukaryotic-like serine/threonine-protein kinase